MSDALRDEYVAAIEAENDELREKVRVLEELVGFREEVPPIFCLTPAEGRVLGFLTKREVATKEQIMMAIYTDRPWIDVEIKIVDVFVCKIRKKIAKFGVEIDTIWGRGYRMLPASKAIIKQFLTPEPVA